MTLIITGENQFTEPKFFSSRLFTATIVGTFTAKVTVQRVNQNEMPDAGTEWRDVEEYSEASELNGLDTGGHWYRIGVKTGDFTSGTIKVAIY